ncbi:MAG: FAD-dependent oxidoreductase [Spirochaetales bacterium]|nr:FAD-dependent oxidoreductase [Spirochaetales bacterium]
MHRIVRKSFDVAVIGGGPGGIPAAVAAARRGKKVILVERNAFLGGAATSGLGILGYIDRQGNKALGGIAQEFIDRLMKMHGALGHNRCPVHNSISGISPEAFKIVAVQMCLEAGVEIFFNQELLDVKVENNRVTAVTVYGKCTETVIEAKVFVDATGDGDLAYMAGAAFHLGQDGTGLMQPSTLMFTVTNYDLDRFLDWAEKNPTEYGIKEDYADGVYNPDFFRKTPSHCFIGLTETIKKAKAAGDFDIPRNQWIYITTPTEGCLAINTSRITDIDASDPQQLSDGLVKGYQQVSQLVRFMNKYVPGFENCRLSSIAPSLGIRETRHFEGVYTLTRKEMYSDYVRRNAIAQSAYNIDIHSGNASHIDLTPVSEPFGIPYGCLVPRRIDSLLLSGRTISVDTETYASARVMGPCIAVGEACGEAAVISIDNDIEVRDVDVDVLRRVLADNGNIF